MHAVKGPVGGVRLENDLNMSMELKSINFTINVTFILIKLKLNASSDLLIYLCTSWNWLNIERFNILSLVH